MRYIILELRRSVFNVKLLIGMLIVSGVLALGSIEAIENYYDFSEAMYMALYAESFLALMWTMVGSVPWVNSGFSEKRSGFSVYMQSKVGTVKYYVSKFICTYISAFMVVLLPELILTFIFLATKGTNVTFECVYDASYLVDMAINNPVLYALVLMVTTSLATASYAVISLALSVFIDNRIIVAIIPFALYAVTYLSVRGTALFFLSGSFLYDVNDCVKPYYGVRAVMYVVYFIVFLSIYVIGSLKTNEKYQVPHTKTV